MWRRTTTWWSGLCCLLLTLPSATGAGEKELQTAGYVPLFNGRDLTGWGFRPSTEDDKKARANWQRNDPNAPPWPIVEKAVEFDGMTTSTNGRYVARDGRLVVTEPPEGRKIQQIYTTRDFAKDFVLKLEFRASPNADSGIFVRGRQLQCRDYALAGPYRDLKHYRPQQWNQITIVVRDNEAHCTCNGEVLETQWKVPASGPIGLEGDRGILEYRNIFYREITSDLPRSTPGAQGVAVDAIRQFVDALDAIDSVHSVMVLRNAHVISEGWWEPYGPNVPHQLYSLSKSFTSAAVGLAISENKLSLSDRVADHFRDELPKEPSENLRSMRVRDLLTMSTGHVAADLQQFSFTSETPLTTQFLALPVQHKPGTHFLYNTPATYMCSAIVQRVTGEKTVDYLQPRLFTPLGIPRPQWTESAQGISHGGFGLSLRTEEIARFGQLLLQRGEWNGEQLVPAAWIDAATARQTSNGSRPDSDWEQGYGFQFWRCRYGHYRGDGAFGQFCIVMPEHNLVLAVTSGTGNMGSVMQAAWDHLLPGIGDAVIDDREDADQLKQHLKRLRLTPLKSTLDVATMNEKATTFARRSFQFAENDAGIETLTLHFQDGVQIRWTDESGSHALTAGFDEWEKQKVDSIGCLMMRPTGEDHVLVAGSAAWQNDATLRLRFWLLETPFRIDVTLAFSENSVKVSAAYHVAFGNPRILDEVQATAVEEQPR